MATSTEHPRFQARRGARLLVGSLTLTLVVVTACSRATAPEAAPPTAGVANQATDSVAPETNTQASVNQAPALKTGRRVAALDFAVPSTTSSDVSANTAVASTRPIAADGLSKASSARDAVSAFFDSLIDQRADDAFTLLSAADQARLGSPRQLAATSSAFGWTSFRVENESPTLVTVSVSQTARVSEIDGVIAPRATVVVPVATEDGSFRISWSKRVLSPLHPERNVKNDSAVSEAALQWAMTRRSCKPSPIEFASGLIGVTGLADALCNSSSMPTVAAVADLESLDEPQAVIDGFGSDAVTWARVVELGGPVRMNVVLAPLGDSWVVVAIARPSLASQASQTSQASQASQSTSVPRSATGSTTPSPEVN